MPWKEIGPMDERIRFISRLLEGERMTDLCQEFEISRKTGYKFLSRYEKHGAVGLHDFSRRPKRLARQTAEEIEKILVSYKHLKPTWGPKKLKVKLDELHPGLNIPAPSTIGEILERHGLVKHRNRHRFSEKLYPTGLSKSEAANDIWAVDFKGQFRLLNQKYCYPLTVTDDFSRFLLGCDSLENTRSRPARECFEALFEQYGLPSVIRSDNGTPFSSLSLGGLSELSVWWIRLGIRPERIQPGHPEQNGKHERFHLTLKAETTRPPAKNHLQQQEKFDFFQHDYNSERPHEALDMKVPGWLYKPSPRPYSDKEPEYPTHDRVVRVGPSGGFRFYSKKTGFLGRALRGQPVGFRKLENKIWIVHFATTQLGYWDESQNKLLPENPLAEEDKKS